MCTEREKDKLGVKESESFLSFPFLFFSVRGEYYIYIYKYIFLQNQELIGTPEEEEKIFFPLKYIALLEVLELKREAALLIHADLMIMTAAVDMKPTLTIIKAEKMDGE